MSKNNPHRYFSQEPRLFATCPESTGGAGDRQKHDTRTSQERFANIWNSLEASSEVGMLNHLGGEPFLQVKLTRRHISETDWNRIGELTCEPRQVSLDLISQSHGRLDREDTISEGADYFSVTGGKQHLQWRPASYGTEPLLPVSGMTSLLKLAPCWSWLRSALCLTRLGHL